MLTWNLDQSREEEVEVGVSREADRGQRESVVAEGDDEPSDAEIEEPQEQVSVLDEVQHRLLLGGDFNRQSRLFQPFDQIDRNFNLR